MTTTPWKCENCDFAENTLDECDECGKRRGWSYDGPQELGDTTHESLAEKMDSYRRLK